MDSDVRIKEAFNGNASFLCGTFPRMRAAPPTYFSERFSIKDLELFSGIKAHTIRAWERRFGLLKPSRSDTNIRSYGIGDLKTILNTSLLLKEGMAISQVAELTVKQRNSMVLGGINRQLEKDQALNALKIATLTYDEELFERTSRAHRVEHGFESLVEHLYLPLLKLLSLLWQSSAICSAQEHFCSNLIRQKLISAIDAFPLGQDEAHALAILYLPENELHELGLLYLQYRLRREGRRSLYLGESVPLADLRDIADQCKGPLDFCSIFTMVPQAGDELGYLKEIASTIPERRIRFHFCGQVLIGIDQRENPDRVYLHPDINTLVKALEEVRRTKKK